MMVTKWFHKGDLDYEKDYTDALFVREEVFVKEQGFKGDVDEIDDVAYHLLVYADDGQPAATLRIFSEDGGKTMHVGRVATLSSHRGLGLGALLMQEAEAKASALGACSLTLSAQVPAEVFYLKQGFRSVSGIYYDQFCRHVDMVKELRQNEW